MSAIYFVPDPELLLYDRPLPYNLFINSSSVQAREHFIRILPRGEILTLEDFEAMKHKYQQIYLSEEERGEYLKGACQDQGKTENEKVTILKSTAISHLESLFDTKRDLSVDVVNQTLVGCRQTVEGFVYLVKDYDLAKLHELIGNLSFHDYYTYDHSINVSMYCILIHKLIYPNASEIESVNAGMGGFLHDIGKIRISNRILNKVGKLSDEEFAEIKRHPEMGKIFLSQQGVQAPKGTEIGIIRNIVYQHHENYDGTGYPDKVGGEKIHEMARIAAVADFFDAITTKRAYSEALTVEEALHVMRKTVGKKLDPKIFELFYRHMTTRYNEKVCMLDIAPDFDPCQPHIKLKREKHD